MDKSEIRPQPGFQELFLSSTADIVIGGSGAGVGKSFAELLEPLRNKDVKGFNAIFFRRTTVQITNPGGLWDESMGLYPRFGAYPQQQKLRWVFKSGATLKFGHLEHEFNVYDHQGAQYCLIIFDELVHFTKKMFFYLLSRNRSTCGVKPYVRASCNPDSESWVADLIEWWIDQEERLPSGEKNPRYGYPIVDRVGVVRYFLVDNDNYVWGDSKEEVISKCEHIFNNPDFDSDMINPEDLIKSITFIPGSIYENKKLLEKNPEYLGNLMALDEDEKTRLMKGNWKVKIDPLSLFNAVSIENMFDNLYPSNTSDRFITVDAARLGEDLCTIWVWYGWKVAHLEILTTSLPQEAVDAIENLRKRFEVIKGRVIVDQDGVGFSVVKLGRYVGFSGNDTPLIEPGVKIKEYYKNRKTQFYYHFAEKINNDEVCMPLSNENVVVDHGAGVKIKLKGRVYDVRDLIKADFRAIKMKDRDGEGKKQINSKEEQKTILRGRSPDFSDGAMLRIHFDFKSGGLKTGNPTRPGSLLDRL
jgi:hypothetical protein